MGGGSVSDQVGPHLFFSPAGLTLDAAIWAPPSFRGPKTRVGGLEP